MGALILLRAPKPRTTIMRTTKERIVLKPPDHVVLNSVASRTAHEYATLPFR